MIIFFSCNQCFTKHRSFSFFLLKQLVTWQPLFALWTVKWEADCCGRQARWMSRYGRIHVATQRYLNGRIFSDLVGQPTVLHLNTIQFKRLARVDTAPFLCMKPADKTELLWHLLETWAIISCGELSFFHIAISKDKLFRPHLSRETNTSETDDSKPGAKENWCSPHGWIPPRVNAGDVLNIRAQKKKAAISPSTSSPLICPSVCVLLPPPLASLSLEAGGKGREQRLSSHERNNFIQTPLCVNTQLQHISI